VHSILKYKTLAFATLIIWLLAGWSGLHSHMCFDGQEPPVTVHVHNPGDHADHDISEQHVDADLDLSQPLLIKLVKIDLSLLIAVALLLAALFEKVSLTLPSYSFNYASRRNGVRPPLRAPPSLPA